MEEIYRVYRMVIIETPHNVNYVVFLFFYINNGIF